jgi:predicted transcriptional regulator
MKDELTELFGEDVWHDVDRLMLAERDRKERKVKEKYEAKEKKQGEKLKRAAYELWVKRSRRAVV